MCGIAGLVDIRLAEKIESVVYTMASTFTHRGPDDAGVWTDKAACIALAHRRLSILDVSPAGHQPMLSVSGRYVIAFNGEIYNHENLRKKLAAGGWQLAEWKGHSDTETLLAGFEAWGIEATLKRSVGMFALAVWDRQERRLILARDRMGEKPLYYGWCGGGFVFGSELKALRRYPSFSNAVSRDVLTLYLRYSYIPAPYSIYKNIYKLEPGCMLTVSQTGTLKKPDSAPHAPCDGDGWAIKSYWSLHEQVMDGQAAIIHDENEAITALESTLTESIRLQSIADVPLGAFLSGGIDSSLIAALMQIQATRPVQTFTLGFAEDAYSEAIHAKVVAEYLGTEHTELYVNARQAMEVIPFLPTLYDEPFADSSQIPTFLVAQMARQHVTVALSGDGGDELFGGYNRYFWGPRIWNTISWLPDSIRQKFCRILIYASKIKFLNQQGRRHFLSDKLRVALLGEKVQKLGQRLEHVGNIDDFYLSLVSEWKTPEEIVISGKEPETLLSNRAGWPELRRPEERMMYLDAMAYLPDDILCKVDRAAMGVSLETRVPFLDYRLVEMAWRIPLNMKIRKGQGKWALRQILYKYVPKKLIDRPKQGFAVPLGQWLRGPLRDWAEHLLDPARLAQEGYFRPEPIRRKWREHVSGKRNWEHSLWSIVMFQAWLETQQEST